MNNKLALIVAVVLGIVSVFGIHMYIQKIRQSVLRQQELVDVFVATRNISKGERIAEGDIRVEQKPVAFVASLKNSNITDRKLIASSTAAIEVEAGQIFQTYHVNIREGGQAGLEIPPGYRAVTISVDAISGISGMIRPGDYVDLVGCYEVKGIKLGGTNLPQLTTTILKKIQVLATDTSTDPDGRPNYTYRTVTLRVKPRDATKVIHAQNFGTIFLILRRDEEPPDESFYPVVSEDLLKQAQEELSRRR